MPSVTIFHIEPEEYALMLPPHVDGGPQFGVGHLSNPVKLSALELKPHRHQHSVFKLYVTEPEVDSPHIISQASSFTFIQRKSQEWHVLWKACCHVWAATQGVKLFQSTQSDRMLIGSKCVVTFHQ